MNNYQVTILGIVILVGVYLLTNNPLPWSPSLPCRLAEDSGIFGSPYDVRKEAGLKCLKEYK